MGLAIDLWTHTGVLVLLVLFGVALWSGWAQSRVGLRAVEFLIFGLVTAFFAWSHWLSLTEGRDGWDAGVTYSGYISLRWLAMIVIYGVLIPNTWQQCARVVLGMAVLPVAVSIAAGWHNSAVDVRSATPFVAEMALWMVTAAVTAIYGCHRIEALHREAVGGRALGQYQLGERLGGGAMGDVFRASHPLLHRPCAIKLICPGWAADPRFRDRFEREVERLAGLTHPNTVRVYDYGRAAGGELYCVMEHLPGLTLAGLVRADSRSPSHPGLPPGRVVHLLRQACGALREAHCRGLIHRDIKPDNIMVCERGARCDVVKLIDFGLAWPVDSPAGLTDAGVVVGTPLYMAPERTLGEAGGARSDLYSLGCVAYFLLTGHPPFDYPSRDQVIRAHRHEAPVALTRHRTNVPTDLEAIVLRCLAKDPGTRYADAEALEQALATCSAAGAWSAGQAEDWWRQFGPND